MKTMKAAKRTLAMLCAIVAATFALTGTAFAATVHGADFSGDEEAIKAGSINVLNVDGKAGETVFLSVKQGETVIAKFLPHVVGKDASAGDGFTWAGTATLNIKDLSADNLNGAYTIQAFADRAGNEELYSGKLYGVYADLPNKTSVLIGTRTVNDAEATGRTFAAPTNIYSDGKSYRLKSDATGKDQLHFAYEEYDPEKTVDAVISFRDGDGNVVATKTYKVTSGEPLELTYDSEQANKQIPSVVVAENGDRYRTVFLGNKIVMENPGKTSYSMYCVKISKAEEALAGYYTQKIQMVDEAGNVIAEDSVYVTGNFVYTLPQYIYKKVPVTSMQAQAVVTYEIDGSNTIEFTPDGMNGTKPAKQVQYKSLEPTADTQVTFNLIDGSKSLYDRKNRTIKAPQVVTATVDSPTVVPDETIVENGTTYNIVGSPDDYAYTLRQGQFPIIDVYYIPEGFTADQSYDFTVNYVNYVTNEVIQSQSYTSNPGEMTTVSTDASFTSDGVEYVRLDGQEDDIQHSYYSGIGTYVVYYRDVNDTLTSGTVITRMRVEYRDGGVTGTVVTDDGTTVTTAPGAAAGGAAAAGAAGTAGGATVTLNPDTTYNVADGAGGNGTLTNEAGVDSQTERIEDSETPLASGFDKGGASTAASALSAAMIPIGIGILVAIVIAALFMMIRRRKNDEANEA